MKRVGNPSEKKDSRPGESPRMTGQAGMTALLNLHLCSCRSNNCPLFKRAISSVGEHCLHTAGVAGSKPASPTIYFFNGITCGMVDSIISRVPQRTIHAAFDAWPMPFTQKIPKKRPHSGPLPGRHGRNSGVTVFEHLRTDLAFRLNSEDLASFFHIR